MQLFIGMAQARSERKRSGAYARVDGNTVIAYWENNQRLKGLYFKPITQSTSTVSGVFLFSFDLLLVVVWTARQRIFLINFVVVVVLFTLWTIGDGSLLGWVWSPFPRNHLRRIDSNWILGIEFDTEPLEVISKLNILLKFKHNLFLFALHFMKTVNYFIRPLSLLLLLFLLQWLSLPFRNILGGWQRDSRHENAVAIVLLSEENIGNCFLIQNCCIRFRCRLLIACSSGCVVEFHTTNSFPRKRKKRPTDRCQPITNSNRMVSISASASQIFKIFRCLKCAVRLASLRTFDADAIINQTKHTQYISEWVWTF